MSDPAFEIIVEPVGTDGRRSTESKIDRVVEALRDGKAEDALRLAQPVAQQRRMGAIDGARLADIFRALGEEDTAAALLDRTKRGIAAANAGTSQDHELVFDCANTLGQVRDADGAIPLLRHALSLKPDDPRPAFPLLTFLLQDNKPDEAIADWLPVLKACQGQAYGNGKGSDALWSTVIRALSYFGFPDHARDVIAQARQVWTGDPVELDKMERTASGEDQDVVSLADAIAGFDAFAEVYDENLEAIGNQGPFLISTMVDAFEWPAEMQFDILDAGCGTGLCAPFLRPFAKMLHGCDLSIPMLEKSKDREIYDLLTRTDLSNLITYPEGIFDVVVAADVFVYFGDLVPVLKNLSTKLKPGGWLLFSVEDATRHAPSRGWEKHPSGRFRHMPDYVLKSLNQTGFTKPKQQLFEPLRQEFGVPVPGMCVASQKLSLVFGNSA